VSVRSNTFLNSYCCRIDSGFCMGMKHLSGLRRVPFTHTDKERETDRQRNRETERQTTRQRHRSFSRFCFSFDCNTFLAFHSPLSPPGTYLCLYSQTRKGGNPLSLSLSLSLSPHSGFSAFLRSDYVMRSLRMRFKNLLIIQSRLDYNNL